MQSNTVHNAKSPAGATLPPPPSPARAQSARPAWKRDCVYCLTELLAGLSWIA